MDRRHLIFIRHAHSQVQPGLPASRWELSETGREQCVPLAERLLPYLPAVLFSSLEIKAKQTAEAVGQILGLAVQTAPDLHEHARETIPYFETQQAFIQAVVRMLKHPDQLLLGEETAAQAQKRFDRAARRVAAGHPHENVWIVTHGTVLALFVGLYNPISIVDFWRGLAMPDVVPLRMPGFRLPASG